ncbi:hypothetical protein [Halococcus hamelinensis]|uniref:Ig-like domain-containing protein n=1 Tax=Halococcus hamelinensis 100A6 TaxID=1132509 RepID=M0M0P6_9EURY|nr:hypothetical protein [Halococcus hamelinensis]EMA39251.1 hypothetical protein C447_07033 [Halococcus hamelinensis 100A6]
MNRGGGRLGRRTFLALGVSTSLAGCVGGGGGSSNDSTTAGQRTLEESTEGSTVAQAPSNTPATTGTVDGGWEPVRIDSDRDEPRATAIVGSGESLGGFTVWNDAETTRKIDISVRRRITETPSFEGSYRLESDAYVGIDISTAGDYVVSVGLADDDPERIEFTVDDCNEQGLSVAVRSSGKVEWSGISTMMACMTATLTGGRYTSTHGPPSEGSVTTR